MLILPAGCVDLELGRVFHSYDQSLGIYSFEAMFRKHPCVICDCDLFLLLMGCIGANDVVVITQCEHLC